MLGSSLGQSRKGVLDSCSPEIALQTESGPYTHIIRNRKDLTETDRSCTKVQGRLHPEDETESPLAELIEVVMRKGEEILASNMTVSLPTFSGIFKSSDLRLRRFNNPYATLRRTYAGIPDAVRSEATMKGRETTPAPCMFILRTETSHTKAEDSS